MPNILINPNSGILEFNTGIAGSSAFDTNLSGLRMTYDKFGALNLLSYNTNLFSGLDRFTIDGSNGRLFSVTDSLSGSLFSVNDIAGLPIIEAFDDNTVVMGAFNRNDFVLSGNSLGIGAVPNPNTSKLYVGGNLLVSGNIFISGNQVLTGVGSFATTTNLFATGSTLDNKINSLSGYVNTISAGGTLPSSIVYNTGNQTISGNKNFKDTLFVRTISGLVGGYLDDVSININAVDDALLLPNNNTVGGSISLTAGSGKLAGGNINLYAGKENNRPYNGSINAFGNLYINNDPTISRSVAIYKTGSAPYNVLIDQNYVDVRNNLLVSGISVTPAIYVDRINNQIISGNKTFVNNVIISGTGIFDAIDLNNIDTLNLSGVDISITNGNVILTNRPTVNGTGVLLIGEASNVTLPNTIVYTTGDQTISGIKNFNNGLATTYISGVSGSSLDIIGFSGRSVNINAGNSSNSSAGDVTLTAGSSNALAGSINLIAGTGTISPPSEPVGINLYAGPSPRYNGSNNIFGNINVNYYPGAGQTSPIISPKTISIYRSGNVIVPFPTPTITPSQLLGVLIDNNKVDVNNGMVLQVSGVNVTPSLYATSANLDNKISSLSGNSVLTFGDQIIRGVKSFVSNAFFQNDITVTGNLRVTGTSYFNDNINVSGNLTVGGNINNSSLVLTKGRQIISGNKTFADNVSINSYTGNGYDTSNLDLKLNIGGNTNENVGILIDSFGTNPPQILMRRARGNPTGLSGVLKDDVLFNLQARGYTSGLNDYSTNSRAAIRLLAAEDWVTRNGYTGQGTNISFRTTNIGGSGLAIDKVIINTSGLNVLNGDIYISGNPVVNTTSNQIISGVKTFASYLNLNQDLYSFADLYARDLFINKIWDQEDNASSIHMHSGSIAFNLSRNDPNQEIPYVIIAPVNPVSTPYIELRVAGNVYARNLLYNSGNQNISGIKNFASRPTVNGTGVLLIGEASSAILPNTIVYTTGDQIISGNKTFINSIVVSGTGNFNAVKISSIDRLFLSGVDVVITGNSSINVYNQIYISGNPVVTGSVQLGSYATSANLALTGSTLDNKINSLSGYVNTISAGGTLPNTIVYTTGSQIISGNKTFIDSGVFSNAGVSALPLLNNPLSVVGSGNSYVQLNIQNRATGTNATADLVITANNGTDNTNYINLGINNSGYNDPTFSNGTGLDGYLFTNGGSLDIGTQTPNTAVEFHIGGTTANRTISRIDSSGMNMVSGTYRVNNVPYNTFLINFLSSNANLAVGQNYISNVGAGYSNTFTDRSIPMFEPCTARKASISLLNSGPGNNIAGITGYFINTSTNPPQTGIINSAITAPVGSNQFTFTGAFSTPINISFGDNVACSLNSNNTATNVRTAASIYCYN